LKRGTSSAYVKKGKGKNREKKRKKGKGEDFYQKGKSIPWGEEIKGERGGFQHTCGGGLGMGGIRVSQQKEIASKTDRERGRRSFSLGRRKGGGGKKGGVMSTFLPSCHLGGGEERRNLDPLRGVIKGGGKRSLRKARRPSMGGCFLQEDHQGEKGGKAEAALTKKKKKENFLLEKGGGGCPK